VTAAYRLEIKRSAEKEIRALPREAATRVVDAIRELGREPRGPGSRKLAGADGYRVRVGAYRVLYAIDDDARVVTIVAVGHRHEVYR
jgi:mRNA interferase RelE/StbE